MESVFRLPYTVLLCPNIKLKKPSWVRQPSAMVMFAVVLTSYFLVTGGVSMFSIPFIRKLSWAIIEVTVTLRNANFVFL